MPGMRNDPDEGKGGGNFKLNHHRNLESPPPLAGPFPWGGPCGVGTVKKSESVAFKNLLQRATLAVPYLSEGSKMVVRRWSRDAGRVVAGLGWRA